MSRVRARSWAAWAAVLALVMAAGTGLAAESKDKPGKKAAESDASQAESDALRQALDGKSADEKVAYLRDIVDSGKATKETYFHLGNAEYEKGDLPAATTAFEQAVAADSTFFKAVVNLGLMYDSQQNYPKALETFEYAAQLEPENPDVWSHMGNTYYSQNNYPKAMELYQKALHYDPKAAHALYSVGVAFADAGIFREAVNYWKQVVQVDPSSDLGKNASENIELLQRYLIP
jgi:tetratricopeptide (TPR) repeat protein